jgi:tRNA(Ile)-lysidine synthase
VSGGAVSVCLLHVLRELGDHREWTARLAIVHFNHKLRGEESDEDEAFVRGVAAELGLPFHARDVEPRTWEGENLEQAARDARRAFFRDLIRQGAVNRIATAHTRSDQAETVLFRLLRGTGPAGLRGVLPVTAEGLIRPLLDVTRAQVERYLVDRQIPWRQDSSNLDLRFARNRIRHVLLPALRDDWNPRIDELLAQTAELAAEDETYWAAEVDRAWPDVVEPGAQAGGAVLRVAKLDALPDALARRLIRKGIAQARGDLRQLEFAHIERILDLAGDRCGHGRIRLPGLEVLRSFGWLRFAREPLRPAHYSFQIPAPGTQNLPGGRRLRLDWVPEGPKSRCDTVGSVIRVSSGRREFEVRNWRPGDRYQPAGRSRVLKIKDLFQASRIPFWDRPGWPMLLEGPEIIWAERFGAAAERVAKEGTGPALRIVLEKCG